MVTIQDVAALAQTSPSTVSNVLNGRTERMKQETLERVEAAITQLNYRPNQAARHLKTGMTPLLGLLVPSVANPFWGGFAQQAEQVARTHGYQVLLGNSGRDTRAEEQYADSLLALGIRGLIHGSSPLSQDHLARMTQRGMHVVTFDYRDPGSSAAPGHAVTYDSVSIDNVAVARLAVEHLIALGHRRIGLLSGPLRTSSRQLRYAGYRAALGAAGIPLMSDLIWEATGADRAPDDAATSFDGYGDVEGAELGRLGTISLMRREEPPTAILAINDMYALGAYAATRDLGLTIPRDVSVVGIDDIAFAKIASPPLTTVRQPLNALLTAAIPRLIARIEGRDAGEPTHRTIPAELVVRESTGPAP